MATRLSEGATRVLAALREHVEYRQIREDREWGGVYLDNAYPTDLSRRQFAGFLGALERAGLYVSCEDDCFGEVLMESDDENAESDV